MRGLVQSWTGGIGRIGRVGHERLNKILVSTHIRPWCGTSVRTSLVPLESRLIGDVGGVVNRITARAPPNFAVSMAHKEACNDNTDYCTEHNTTNAGSNDCTDGDTGTPG